MDTATFSSKRKPPPPPPSSSKTAASGGYFSTSYDDVFGGPPKFTTTASSALVPRAEDYSEIFSGFRTSSSSRASSSIPVLDLPAVNGGDFDSVLDYSDVFGGLNSVDFAVPFGEFFRSSDGFDASDDDDAWTPIGTESLSDDSDPFAFSEKSQNFLNGNANQPLEGKQYNVSYHKVNPGTSTCIPDAMHVTQLDDFPEYTCVVEEATSLRVMDQQKFCSQVVEDIVINMESPPIITHEHHKKCPSHFSHEDMGLKSLESDPRSCRSHSASLSHVNTVSASDINLLTNSSHYTPPSSNSGLPAGPGERNKGTNGLSSGPKAFEGCGFETTVDGSVPPFFDMEVDASSSAAVTAAAMKDVMEKAQTKLKAAREFRGRKDNFQNGGEVVLETEVNGGEIVGLAHIECASEERKLPGKIERESSKIKSYSKARHGISLSQILPDNVADEQPIGVSEKPIRIKCNSPMDVSSNDVGGEWKAAKQYFEFVSNDNSRLAYQPPNKGDGNDETYKEQDSNDNDSDSSSESFVPQTNRRRLKATKAVSRQGYYERMFKVAQEVHDTVTSGHAETKEEVQDIIHEDRNEQKPDSIIEPERDEGNVWDSHRAEVTIKAKAEMKSKNVPENECMETRETKASNTALNRRGGNDPLVNMTNGAHYIRDGESGAKGTWEREENGKEAHEGIVWDSHRANVTIKAKAEMKSKNVPENECMETRETKASNIALNGRGGNDPLVTMTNGAHYIRDGESGAKGTWKREENGKEAHQGIVELSKETLKQRQNKESWEVKDKRSKVAFGDVFSGKRLQTTIESKEEDRTKDMQKMKAECWRPTEVLEAKVTGQKLDRTCEELDNYKTTESQQINEHDGHLGKATKDQGPEMMLDENVKLEKCWEYLETLEQEKSRMNLEKDCKLVGGNYYADNKNKDEEEEEKFELTSEKRNVHVGEETDFKVDLNGGFRSQVETEEEDEDQQSDSSSDIELSINDKHQKSSSVVNVNGEDVDLDGVHCILKVPRINTNGFLKASSGKEKSEIDSKVLDDNYVKGFETADVQIDAKQSRSDAPQADPSNKELEGKPDATPFKMSEMKGDGSVEISSGEENGDIGTVLSEETRSKDVETAGVMGERQIVFPAAQECPIADELERRLTLRMNEKNSTSAEVSARHGQFIKKENTEVADAVSDPNLVKGSHLEGGGMFRKIGVDQVLGGMEENIRPTQYEKKNGWNEHPIKRVGVHPIIPDRKQCFQSTSQVSSFSQNIERNGKIFNHNGSLEMKDGDRKIDLEKEHLRKLEEEREREREREKDKMAVEIAIREARERAYADARDRAERAALERATEEIRQKAMSEARERLEKACSEAREKSLSDKTSEARLRAERAAVERATSEARQRAFEKSMADRAMFETRERVQRTMSEKFISERDEIMRQSSFPPTSERFELAIGEPTERCKARLERHRRTVERVAKALEEKNNRDLLAQREQAERNRFAETLDADIKRWSNGKAGNLRALLSTLQYILGPDSGWQPIPLTDVITATAVKKAYRKATLCVHPDKLQQRGASIQQKYISEKVFDLLKDAWNRFNSEEK